VVARRRGGVVIGREWGAADAGTVRARLTIRRSVLDRVRREIAAYPDVEVGGKFVGFVEGAFGAAAEQWSDQLGCYRITVESYIDAGPGADRSPTHHLSDVDYQHRVFTDLRREFPTLQFLGLWHSHHPNGLEMLSGGDTRTGHGTVDSLHHDLDLLLSSLAVDHHGLRPDLHHLFLRGHERHYRIDPSCVQVDDSDGEVDAAMARSTRSAAPAAAAPVRPTTGPRWMDTAAGRRLLAAEHAWLSTFPGLRPALNGGRVLWRGCVAHAGVDVEVVYVYPEEGPTGVVAATVTTRGAVTARAGAEFTDPATRPDEFEALLDSVTDLRLRLAAAHNPRPAPPTWGSAANLDTPPATEPTERGRPPAEETIT
jgi:hypothetical protein